ncbi:acyl-CoA dehydrogenase family protein [Streptomyces microflavus]|uniref:Acyl-CoA dehydrogenase n=2 Tax=Streptomyces microflavus TaxID=1919 RepID=A0A7J0CVI2_STRMI|nr:MULTISPECIES: acyl-CoA dehydrogenase family protein [Streptomyces]AGK79552.1 Acyl-CoA dehydrogenase type 2 domain protein [Streptomyces microflavus DSM 40593]MCX4654702.1 acyl-CoA dehydrogenase family protein [Streptomyces microflavus]MDX2404962.1 acyl-CoA dehydrogenase family protein [Streptomyces microflavus]MDX2975721.1 acyl-CoA dehydrogenase family protein [Streptomyces sp. NRRL_B-2249]WSA62832.1 acyl-CoA dehydrogenase family protein [Streptomyces microflavus]
MATNDDLASVLEAVRSSIPTLRENGLAGEDQRWLPEENLDLLEKAGVFRMAVPARFGGMDLPLADQAKVIAEIGRGCPATAWVTMVWVSSTWTATLYPDQAQKEIFAPGSVRISSAFAPTGTVVETEGGYILNGSWRFNTGSPGAHWNFTAAMLERPDGSHEEVMAIVPMDQLTVADDWHVSAGSATGSATSTAKDVFVPAHHVTRFEEVMVSATGNRSNTGATGRNYGLLSFVMAECAAVFIGIARGAYELFLERVPGRGITYTDWTDQKLHPLTQIQVATAANKIDAAEALSERWLSLLQERADAGVQPTDAEKAIVRGQTGFAAQLAKEAVEILFNASGGSVIQRSVHLQRFHRDIQGFSLHALAQADVNLELQGRVLLGLEPGTVFL